MSQPAWYVEPDQPDSGAEVGSAPALVTLHYLSGALRRRWAVCVASAVLGALIGAFASVLLPAPASGTVTLMLSHEPGTDPAIGMATDVSLLRTRAVAAATVEELGLDMSPDEFHRTVRVEPATPTVLVLTVAGPDDADAVERVEVLARKYLDFRREQLMSQADATAAGYQEQVDALQDQVDDLTARYDELAGGGRAAADQAAAVLTERSQRASEIVRLQQMIEDTTLRAAAVIGASHVLDPAGAVPRSGRMRTVLATASGLVGGAALGVAGVLFLAVTTARLRRREEIGLALGVPVRASVTRLRPPRPWRRVPGASRALGMQVLLHVLEDLADTTDTSVRRIGVVATSDTADAEPLLVGLAGRLTQRGRDVFVADLSTRGELARMLQGQPHGQDRATTGPSPHVFRPDGPPQLARGPLHPRGDWGDLRPDGAHREAWDRADVVLALAEVDPALEADALATWVESIVYVVTAGRSSAERLRTVAQLVAQAGLHEECALLVGSDHADESIGIPPSEGASASGAGARR